MMISLMPDFRQLRSFDKDRSASRAQPLSQDRCELQLGVCGMRGQSDQRNPATRRQ
jgi:hypothetical protein